MRKHSLALSCAVLLVGCGQAPKPQFRSATTAVRISPTQSSAEDFVPLVPAATSKPRCEDLRNPPAALGSRVLSFVYGEPPERRVTVVLDGEGKPKGYSDVRGDLVVSDHPGDFTSITINLVQGHAIAQNRPASGEARTVRIPFDDALSAQALDTPQALLDRVLSTCGGAT